MRLGRHGRGGNAAYLSTTFGPEMGARTVLAALGVEVPEKSPEFDVALDSLIIKNAEFKRLAAARKRQDLLDTVLASVPTKPRTDLAIGRMPTPSYDPSSRRTRQYLETGKRLAVG
jgi:hypothetical protein